MTGVFFTFLFMVTGRGIIFICSTDKGVVLGGNFTDEIGRYDCSVRFFEKCKRKSSGFLLKFKVRYFSSLITEDIIYK